MPNRRFPDLIGKFRFYGDAVRTSLDAVGSARIPPQQEKVSGTNATCWAAPFSVIPSAGGMISIPSWRSYVRRMHRAQFRKDTEDENRIIPVSAQN